MDRRTRPTGGNGPVYLADVSCNSRPSRQLPHQAPSLSALGSVLGGPFSVLGGPFSVLGGPFSIPHSPWERISPSWAPCRRCTRRCRNIGVGAAARPTDGEDLAALESRYCTRAAGWHTFCEPFSDRPEHRTKRNFGGARSLSCNAARSQVRRQVQAILTPC